MRKSVLVPFTFLVVGACDRGGGSPPPVLTTSLTASPAAFSPGELVTLLPRFDGEGRIDPDVGPVLSGVGYVVGPSSVARSYTLTVARAGIVDAITVDVPLRYRERVRELAVGNVPRTRHGAATLSDGRVLLVAGASPSPLFWTDSETFDGEFAAAGEVATGRGECAVVALPDGGAIVLGGSTNSSSFADATRIERWDPLTRSWSVAGSMQCNRAAMTATLLVDGRVLVVGGIAVGGTPEQRDAELFEPGVGSRSPLGEMDRRRAGHTATRLADGRVFVAGGADPQSGELTATTETFDPVTETFVPGPSLQRPRVAHAAIALRDGRVLLIGGDDGTSSVATTEVFDPVTGSLGTVGDLVTARMLASVELLADGRVAVAGGRLSSGLASDSVEVFEPAAGTWREWSSRLPAPRVGHSMHALPDARVVVVGGDPGNGYPLPTCFVLD